jgi:hypothetical protein
MSIGGRVGIALAQAVFPLDPEDKCDPQTLCKWSIKYRKWEATSSVIGFGSLFGSTLAIQWLLSGYARAARIGHLESESILHVRAGDWYVPAFVASIIASIVIWQGVMKGLLGHWYDEYLRYQRNATKIDLRALYWPAIVLLGLSGAGCVAGYIGATTKITASGMSVRGRFAWHAKTYRLADVHSFKRIEEVSHTLGGDIVRSKRYVIEFRNGLRWSSA